MSRSETRQASRKGRRDRGVPVDVSSVETTSPISQPFPSEHGSDPLQGTASISAVTADMIDDVAHKTAEAADAVAHRPEIVDGSDAHRNGASDVMDQAASSDAGAHEAFEAIAETSIAAARAADDTARDVLESSEAVLAPADAVTEQAMADRTGGAARDPATGPADMLIRYNDKVMEIIQGNVAATTALLAALVSAKSVPEAVALNADHLRRQMDVMTAQGRELASLAQKIAFEAMQPIRATVASRFRDR